jgi:hypothetical protein
MLDCDEAGEVGAQQVLFELAKRALHVRIGWSASMDKSQFAGRQPEELSIGRGGDRGQAAAARESRVKKA